MTDEVWKGIIICSIPPTARWLPVILSLYLIISPADIISTLLAHGMILNRGNQGKSMSSSSNTVLAARTNGGCVNPNCKAKKRSTHTTNDCYWPGGGKEGQFHFLPNFGQRSQANATTSTSKTESVDRFVLSAWTLDTPGASGVIIYKNENPPTKDSSPVAYISNSFKSFGSGKIPTFIDSGASDTMLVSRDDFAEYVQSNTVMHRRFCKSCKWGF